MAKGETKQRWGRWVGLGGAGMAAAVALMMALGPAAGAVAANVIMSAPYLGSVSVPSTSIYSNGCAKVTAPPLKWNKTSGFVTGSGKTSANTCAGTLGYLGDGGSASSYSSVSVGIPFKVSSSGSHSIAESWSVGLGSASAQTHAACPKKNITFPVPPSSSESAQCYTETSLAFSISAYVVDLNNNSWYSYNYSDFYNNSYHIWQNSTSCYNFGTPTCSNTTGWSNFSYSFGFNSAAAGFTYNGAFLLTLWTNATAMVSTHHYVLIVSVSLDTSSYAVGYNLHKAWKASANASITMAGTGKGAQLLQISIV